MAAKIIVLGEINGQFQTVFKKLATLHAKNNFSLAIITGNLCADDDEGLTELLDGKVTIPLSTYFTVGTKSFPQRVLDRLGKDEDLCENLHYLGKRSITKTAEGIRIVALGGLLDGAIVAGTSQEQYLPFHTVGDAKALKGANTTDILLTTTWPTNIRRGSKIPLPDEVPAPSSGEHIAQLCQELNPRYHFSSSPEFFYEREPYFSPPTETEPDYKPITRFISMAANGNATKQKAIYAFTLQQSVDTSAPLPAGSTASPFTVTNSKKRAALDPTPYSRFSNGDDTGHHRKRGRRDRGPPPGPESCFFCLSNPNIGTHLILAIGDDAYVTVAKGPLITSTTNADEGLDFPAHALIIPLAHSATLPMITEKEARTKAYDEMVKFKTALQTMASLRSANKLGAVTYEISRGNGVHTHWQFLAMPVELVNTGLVDAGFRVEADNLSYPKFTERDVGVGDGEGDFFRVWIWSPPADDDEGNEGTTKCLVLPLDNDMRFDLQFGRRVLAKLLGLEKRMQWRDCTQSVEAETAEVEAFKKAFKEYDFTV